MFTIKQLSLAYSVPVSRLVKDLALRHRKKFYAKWGGIWYQFPSVKEVIVPLEYAERWKAKNKPKSSTVLKPYRISSDVNENDFGTKKIPVPVVVLLGHFNHGKTTILDKLSDSHIATTEIHGITQEFRSRMVSIKTVANFSSQNTSKATQSIRRCDEAKVTIIDTPGQAIFHRIRDYGAAIADMALLVVAANEGISPQTQESIGILDSLDIPVVVCINKVDLVLDADRLSNLEKELREYVALSSAPIVQVSAMTKLNFDQLTTAIGTILQQTGKQFFNTSIEPDYSSPHTSSATITSETNKEAAIEENLDKDISDSYSVIHAAGIGTIMNIWKNRREGVVLHVIVKEGAIRVGSYFVSGGWSGRVRSIIHESRGDETHMLSEAGVGFAVRVGMALHRDVGQPRPLGDTCYFFENGSNKKDQNKNNKKIKISPGSSDNHRKIFAKDPRSVSEFLMGLNQKEDRIVSSALTDDVVKKLRLEELEFRIRFPAAFAKAKKLEMERAEEIERNGASDGEEDEDEDEDDEEDDEEDEEEEEDDHDHDSEEEDDFDDEEREEKEMEKMGLGKVLIKANSDISLSTILDSIDEANDQFQAANNEGVKVGNDMISPYPPRKVVFSSVGDVNMHDVTVAKAARGVVLLYGVSVTKEAARQCQNQAIQVLRYDCMEDLVRMVVDGPTVGDVELGLGLFKAMKIESINGHTTPAGVTREAIQLHPRKK